MAEEATTIVRTSSVDQPYTAMTPQGESVPAVDLKIDTACTVPLPDTASTDRVEGLERITGDVAYNFLEEIFELADDRMERLIKLMLATRRLTTPERHTATYEFERDGVRLRGDFTFELWYTIADDTLAVVVSEIVSALGSRTSIMDGLPSSK